MIPKDDKIPVLTPGTHLLVAGALGLLTFFLFIWLSDFVIDSLMPKSWNRQIVWFVSFFIVVSAPIFIFDTFVPASCPKCGGKMFGSSFQTAYKECKKCKYMYRYGWFGKD
jgi:hypothetical protein